MSDYDDEGKYAENNFYDNDNKVDNGSFIDTNRNEEDSDEIQDEVRVGNNKNF